MDTTKIGGGSVLGLLRDLKSQARVLIRQEIQLAKAEVSEKISNKAKSGTRLVIGGFVAYAGLIVFLLGLGWLIGFGLTKAGLDQFVAQFIGLGVIGLIIAGTGVILLMNALKAFSKESFVPERTVHTLQEFRGKGPEPLKKTEVEMISPPEVPSKELERRLERTEDRIRDTMDELGRRIKPSYVNARIKGRLSEKPYRNSLIAMGVGVLSGLIVRAKLRRVF